MDTRHLTQKIGLAAIVLTLLELLMRLAYGWPAFYENLATNDDLSYRRAWVRAHRGSAEAVGRVDEHHPLLGWRPRANLRISPIWNGKTLTTNAQGFRALRDFETTKDPARTRILALGDSFTFGEEVGDREVWTHQLETLSPRLEVFNLGVHGYGHDQMLLLLRETVETYRPDVVLLGYLRTDMYRNLLEFRDFAKPRFRLAGGELELVGVPVPTPEEVLRHDRWRPRLLGLGAQVATRLSDLVGLRGWRKRTVTEALLAEIARTSRRAGAQPVFAHFPAQAELDSAAENEESEAFFWEACERIEGVACTSISAPLRSAHATEEGCCREPGGYHWSARGHRLAAEALLEHLGQRGLARRPAHHRRGRRRLQEPRRGEVAGASTR